jgi:hypothetical protein
MMRTLRTIAFGLAEAMRMYLAAPRSTPGDLGVLRGQARLVGAELVRGDESGHA